MEWKSIAEKQEQRIQHLQSTAFQLANYHFVFQGIIIAAISNGTSAFRCEDRWFLITLSAIPAILNLISLLIIGIEYKRALDQQDLNWSCYIHQFRVEKKTRESQVSTSTTDTPQPEDISQASTTTTGKPDPFTNCLRRMCLLLSMLLLFAFTLVTITGCAIFLCRPVYMGYLP